MVLLKGLHSAGYGTAGAGTVAYPAHAVGFVTGALPALPPRRGTPRVAEDRRAASADRRRPRGHGAREESSGGAGRPGVRARCQRAVTMAQTDFPMASGMVQPHDSLSESMRCRPRPDSAR